VGFIGVIYGEGISSTLTIFDGCCLLSYDCTYALVLNLECRAIWVYFSCFGGAIVVNFSLSPSSMVSEFSMSFALFFVCTLALCLF
jgi:hypothetical protein